MTSVFRILNAMKVPWSGNDPVFGNREVQMTIEIFLNVLDP